MSLVNEMLRDLEKRRASPAERAPLEGLQPVDEEGARRREQLRRLRLGLIFSVAVMLIAFLIGVMIGRVSGRVPPPLFSEPLVQPAVSANRVLEVLPQQDNGRFVLQLLLERSVSYQRTDESGAVSFHLPGVRLEGEARSGRLQYNGRSLSWRVEQDGEAVMILLVGLGEGLQVSDRLEGAGSRWQLWLDARLGEVSAEEAAIESLPAAQEAEAEAELPDWSVQPEPKAKPAPAARPQVTVTPRPRDPLAEARQAMLEQHYAEAVGSLETYLRQNPADAEAIGLLARAYLGAGQQQKLLDWLPDQLGRVANAGELRVLLARAQLQAGQASQAVSTLAQQRPLLARDPSYHALLAATYQQTGQWRESADLYTQLVDLRPRQAAWQLGLAIALEQLGQRPAAADHYQLALRGEGLDDNTRRFASGRAQALGGQP